MLDLYELLARARGVSASELTVDEREQLWARALPLLWPGYERIAGSERADSEPIQIEPYDKRWPARFESWRQKLDPLLEPVARRIAHVGSTSVPGLAAKPVIDIGVGVVELGDEASYVPAIESLGVQLRSRDDEHRYFRPFAGRPRDVHIHVWVAGSAFERRHLLFVDYLRTSDGARGRYRAAKVAAAARWPDDRLAYTEAKSEVIARLMGEAEVWARATGWSVTARSGAR